MTTHRSTRNVQRTVATTEPESTLGVQDGSRIDENDENDEKTRNGVRCEDALQLSFSPSGFLNGIAIGGLQSSTLRIANNIANIANIATSENSLRT